MMGRSDHSQISTRAVALCATVALLWVPVLQGRAQAAAPTTPGGIGHLSVEDDEVLAETVGLLMHHAWMTGDRALFEAQVSVVEGTLRGPIGLLSWRTTSDGPAPASASVDDLKVVRALIRGSQLWAEPRWADLGRELAAAVLEHETVDGQLVDAASWGGDTVRTSDTLQTAYLDLGTLAMLIPHDPAWLPVYSRSLEVLREAETEHGLFVEQLARGGKPVRTAGAEVNGIHVLYCAVHLAEVGEGGEPTLAHLRAAFDERGRLPGRYRLSDGAPISGYENRAVYALAARLALLLGDHASAERFLDRMLEMHLLEPVLNRGHRAEVGFAALAFDNLQALISLRQLSLARAARLKAADGNP